MLSSKKAGAKAAERQRRWLEKQQALGLTRVEVRVPKSQAQNIRDVAHALIAGSRIQITPPELDTEDKRMAQIEAPWTLDGLKAAIEQSSLVEGGEFELEIIQGADPVMVVGMNELGGLELFLSICGEQILTSVLLWPCNSQDEPTAFEAMMLRNHKKYLPLSALGITAIHGEEWYELWGSMSSRSVLQNVIMEFRTVAQNAVDLSEDLAPSSDAAA